jgi:class 3 adenylate cyclase/DNA-binding transcriptional MerR regulator
LLTSKEIIERTGISRATLNNYIASGLVPRPQVLPPGPQDGAAPRIGYFPDDTIARVETIQRLKREGWSITRIAEHFAGNPVLDAPAPLLAMPAGARPASAEAPDSLFRASASDAQLRLSMREIGQPAYFLGESFRITWLNDEARSSVLSPLAGGATGSIFPHLLRLDEARGRDAMLQFHLEAARSRSATSADLFVGLPQDEAGRLESLYRQVRAPASNLVSQARIPAGSVAAGRLVYAVQFREGVLFAYVREDAPEGVGLALPAAPATRTRSAAPPAAPAVTSIAVLVSTLQDAAELWVKLTAQEYFELVNEVWAELDRIFRRHRGQPGRHPDEGLVCYFLPQRDSSYVWNALAAAQEVREAMRQVSLRWQARKGWDVELTMNTGIDEGQDWMGAIGASGDGDLRVLGDAADRAEALSRCSRSGAVLVTRSLLGKLPEADRQRIAYGVPRPEGTSAEARLLFSFARLEDIAPPGLVSSRVAGLAVAELLDLHVSPANTPGASAAA